MPCCFRSIIAGGHHCAIIKHACEYDADRVSSRIAAGVSKRANLLEPNANQPGFLGKFPGSRVFK